MQKNILLMMSPLYGHINCTFNLSNRLKKEGYNVIYAIPSYLQRTIEEQGFEVVLCTPNLFPIGNGAAINDKTKLENLFHRVVDRISNFHIKHAKKIAKEMNMCIVGVKPDLIFLDSALALNYFFFEGIKPPTILLQTMLAIKKRPNIPPINNNLLPSQKRKFNRMMVNWIWFELFIKKYLWRLTSLTGGYLKITYRILNKQKKSIASQVDFDYAFNIGIKGLYEFILGPKSLDYDEISQVEQLYLACSMDVPRKEKSNNLGLKITIKKLQISYQDKIWVYCSLGTINTTHNKKCKEFFKKVIHVFASKPNWELIISTGRIKPYHLDINQPNIHIYEKVPQLEILKYCKVMITHGGLNSILECIKSLTPMLVFPLNNHWDQPGNASRVIHYGLGLGGEIDKVKPQEILGKLTILTKSPSFVKNIKHIRNSIKLEDGLEKAMSIIKLKLHDE